MGKEDGDDSRKSGGDCARGNGGISEKRNGSRDVGVPTAVFMYARQKQQPNSKYTLVEGKYVHREVETMEEILQSIRNGNYVPSLV